MKFAPCFFALLAFINFLLLYAYGKSSEVCISQGGRFPPFSKEGKPPNKSNKGPRDMTLCRIFHKRSCCDVTQTHPALLTIRKLASSGEATQACLQLWELLECSICDPRVGVKHGPPIICVSFCDKVYEACSAAYFSMDTRVKILAPCGFDDLLCGKASEWVSNGTELCQFAGFSVESFNNPAEASCYGEKSGLDDIVNSWKTSDSKVLRGEQNAGVLKDLRRWIAANAFNEMVTWAVGGMVLTAGIWFVRKRKSHNQRQKLAAIQYRAKKLGAKINSISPTEQENRRITGK